MEEKRELKLTYLSNVRIDANFRYNRHWYRRVGVFAFSDGKHTFPTPNIQSTLVAAEPQDCEL